MTEHRLRAVHVIGGGLAGSEAAWQIAARGVPIVLHEMRPLRTTAAHQTAKLTGEDALAFFDAIAPIVHRETIDMSRAWLQSRYDKAGPGGSGADYINCPLTREQYDAFVAALLAGDTVAFHDWETPYFDGC